MRIPRRTVLAGSGAVALASVRKAAAAVENPLAAFIAPDGQSIKVVHVTAENGLTSISDTDMAADHSPYPLFQQFLTHKAKTTAIYSAPPHHKIAARKNAGKELLLIVAGETTLEVAGATKRRCPVGAVILLEEGAAANLMEKAGPDGYTALKVALAD